VKPRKKRKSCQQYISERAAQNRDRAVEQTFSELERQALIDRLNTDAAQREAAERANHNN